MYSAVLPIPKSRMIWRGYTMTVLTTYWAFGLAHAAMVKVRWMSREAEVSLRRWCGRSSLSSLRRRPVGACRRFFDSTAS